MSEAGLKADGRLQGRIYQWKSVISPSRDRNQYPPHFFWLKSQKIDSILLGIYQTLIEILPLITFKNP